jgi:uncharacterized membrane protein YedE/YeeE
MLITCAAGLVVGVMAYGTLGWLLWFTRPYRRARNPFVLGLSYFLFLVIGPGSLLLMRRLDESLGIAPRSTFYYPGLYSYVVGLTVVAVIAIRAEFRWRKSIGL